MYQGEDKAVGSPGEAGGKDADSQPQGWVLGDVTPLKVWSIPNRQGSPGATWGLSKASGETATADQQKAEWEGPFNRARQAGKKDQLP